MENLTHSYLRIANSNFVNVPPPSVILIGADDTRAWFAKNEIVYPNIFTCEGNAVGFKKDGVDAVIALAEAFLKSHHNYANATSFQKFVLTVANELIDAIQKCEPYEDYSKFEEKILTCFSNEIVARTHYIPCSISPYQSQTFQVGPVTFYTVSSFKLVKEIVLKDELEQYSYGQLFKFASEQNANWIAEIKVEGYDQTRSSEQADLAIDIALTVLQLLIPSSMSKEVSRSTARTIPRFKGTFHQVGEYLAVGQARCDPCLGYSAEYFDNLLVENKKFLNSVGQRVDSFATNKSTFPKLEQAWCDAAYWFHEGISEKLDTIAITKMEASIEVLLFAESSKGAKDRLLTAFRAIYGLDSKQRLCEDNPRTVIQFITSIVTARSRILHGTLSTLTHRPSTYTEEQHRNEVELLAKDLLLHFTIQLDAYKTTEKPQDNFEHFFEWIAIQKGNSRL